MAQSTVKILVDGNSYKGISVNMATIKKFNAAVWACPRCLATNFDVAECEACGSGLDWKPVQPPSVPDYKKEAEEKAAREQAELDRAIKDAEHKAKVDAAYKAETQRLDKVLAGQNKKLMDEHRALLDSYAATIQRLELRVTALEEK